MHLADYIRIKREARGLNQSALAAQAQVNRNTITNLESGKPLRFPTVVQVMHALGYVDQSPEMRECALLWLEQVSGIKFSRVSAADVLDEMIARDTIALQPLLEALGVIVREHGLTPDELQHLAWAAGNAPAREVVRILYELAHAPQEQQMELRVAEEGEDFSPEETAARRQALADTLRPPEEAPEGKAQTARSAEG